VALYTNTYLKCKYSEKESTLSVHVFWGFIREVLGVSLLDTFKIQQFSASFSNVSTQPLTKLKFHRNNTHQQV